MQEIAQGFVSTHRGFGESALTLAWTNPGHSTCKFRLVHVAQVGQGLTHALPFALQPAV